MDSELVQLLREEYDLESVSDECKRRILKFMRETNSVLDEDIIHIKQLTKKAQYILDSDPDSLDGFLLDKLCRFVMEGILIIETRDLEGITGYNLLSLESHLYSHLGDLANRELEIARKSGKSIDVQIMWLERCYDARIRSADMCVELNPSHSAYSYGFAGDTAEKVFKLLREKGESIDVQIMWLERCYDARIRSADMCFESDMLHAVHSCSFAGNAKRQLYKLTGDVDHAEEAIRCYQIFLDYYESNPNPQMNKTTRIMWKDVNYLKTCLSKTDI